MYQKVTIGQAARALARGEMVFASDGWAIQLGRHQRISIRKARKHVMLFRQTEGDSLLLR